MIAVAQVALPLLVAATVFAAVKPALLVVPARSPRRTGTASPLVRAHASVAGVRARRTSRATATALADDLPDVVDLLAVAAASGCNVRLAVEAASTSHHGPVARLLRSALRHADAGARLSEALTGVVESLPALDADALRPLTAVLVDSDHYGTPLSPALERLSDDLRVHRQRRAEARARRIPVRLLLPLVLCVLPAFALLTVAPLFAGMARDALADSPSISLQHDKELP